MTTSDDNGAHGGEKDDKKKEEYHFFIGKDRYETNLAALTGAQIKARAANVEPGDGLSLEGQGNDPDRMIGDDELVSLEKQHGPRRFTIVPRANFG